MARPSKVEECIFCGCLPCECNGPAKKPAPKKRAAKFDTMTGTPAVVDVQLPEPKNAMREAMKAASVAAANPQVIVESFDTEMQAALSVLLAADILHPDEVAKYRDTAEPKARATAWKERNNGMAR